MFFFSSRRRHTRLQGDWSSDVCSSDLLQLYRSDDVLGTGFGKRVMVRLPVQEQAPGNAGLLRESPRRRQSGRHRIRSEERRVGKEGRGRGAASEAIETSKGTERARE